MNRLTVAEQVFGHNKAPISEVLTKDFSELVKEAEDFLAKADKLPPKIKDDTDLGMFGQHITDLRALAGRVDLTRKDEGKPLLDATRDLNAWFNELKAKLDGRREQLEQVGTDYQRAKAAAARKKAEDDAAELRRKEAAERAKATSGSGVGAARAEGRAENLSSQAERAEANLGAKANDLVRTNVGGVTASAKTVWDFKIEDYDAIDLNKLRPYFARADVEKAIRSLVRIQKKDTNLPGVKVFEDVQATFRK